jgi:hypothetical protein
MHPDQNCSPPRVEVITSVQWRRRWPTAEKIGLVEETMQSGMSVSYVARRAGVAPSLLFNWRRRMLEGGLQAVQADEDVVGASKRPVNPPHLWALNFAEVTKLHPHWAKILIAAKISRLRIHYLRHSYASILASAATPLLTIGELLSHEQIATTHRCAHLINDALSKATETAGAMVMGEQSAEVPPKRKHSGA